MSRVNAPDVSVERSIDVRETRYRDLLNHCAELTQQLAAAKKLSGDLPALLEASRTAKEIWHRRWSVAITVIMALLALDFIALGLWVY